MLVGYNTNVPYKGKLYHVQTEDNGLKNPLVITLLYYKGTILASKKSSYADLISSPDYKEKVRELMKEQHKAMMKELIRGVHGDVADAPGDSQEEKQPETSAVKQEEQPQEQKAGAKQQISRSLDDVLLDYIIRGGK
ncbi:MAG: hypothetical protein M0Z67_15655 [Nitrospiraceae bacterium]|nr:hypothetical protein [Nitrospiraceae bacterium]